MLNSPRLKPQRQPMERRDATRKPCRMPVRVLQQGGDPSSDCFWLDSADLSPGGVFLRTDLLFPVGDQLELEFTIAGRARPVRGVGEIVRVVASRETGPGLAVALHGLAADEKRALARMGSAEGRSVRAGNTSRHARVHRHATRFDA